MLFQVHPGYFLLGLLCYHLSKIVSAFRLARFYQIASFFPAFLFNLKLYYVGMFYNLFLPGGIGGDGYKIFLINKKQQIAIKPLLSAAFLDRLSGLFALVFIGAAFYILQPFEGLPKVFLYLAFAGIFLGIPGFYLLFNYVFKAFSEVFTSTLLFSFMVQGIQVIAAICLMLSLEINENWIPIICLFLISSAVSVLPISVGGAGARELVFYGGAAFVGMGQPLAVAFSLLFFFITALASLKGFFFTFNLEKSWETKNQEISNFS